jgi:hypothetical protein
MDNTAACNILDLTGMPFPNKRPSPFRERVNEDLGGAEASGARRAGATTFKDLFAMQASD